jgi:hypothetical protein
VALFTLAVGAGFLVSSQLGQRWMREEAELQLGRLLGGEVHVERVALRLRYGIEIQGAALSVEYPAPGGRSLSADRVSASLETASLLLGRLRVARLEIEGLRLDLRRDRDGQWSPPYFGRPAQDASLASEADLERRLAPLRRIIESVHFVLRDQQIADHILLDGAVVTLLDAVPRRGATAPAALRLERIRARLDRSRLRGHSDLELEATWVGPDGRPASVEAAGRWRHDDTDLHVAVAFTGIELASLRPYLVSPERRGDIAGRVTGVIAVVTPEPERGLFELDWSFDGLQGETPIGDTRIKLSSPLETLEAQVSLEPRRLRLESARLQGRSIELRIRGSAARPLTAKSLVALRADLSRTELDDLRRLAMGLPPAEAEPFLVMLDRMQSGYVRTVGVRGGARLEQWASLLRGERAALPRTLRVFADIDDVTFGTSPTDTMSDVSGRFSFSADTLEVLGLEGRFNGDPLPRIDLAVRGVSELLGPTPDDERLTRLARPLPGLGALWDLVRGDPEKPSAHPPSPIRIELDVLHHPALRWTLRDAHIEIDPTERDLHIAITDGEWAGRPIRGEAILESGPDPELRIELLLTGPLEARPDATDEASVALERAPQAAGDARDAPWAAGHFVSSGIRAGPVVFDEVEGRLALRGQTLALSDVRADLEAGGVLEGSASLALDRAGEVAIGVDVEARGADADRVARLFGLAAGFASGRAAVRAQLAGPVRPDALLIEDLVGRVVIDASDGEIQMKVPLLAAVAHAIEGWSPAHATGSLQYERIETSIDLGRGRISMEHFALDGPLRVVASGWLDLNQDPVPVEATFGFFLLRQADRLLGEIPVVKLLVPGSDRGLLGAYFHASGSLDEPSVRPMPVKSITEGTPLPDVLRQPFAALQELFTGSRGGGTNGGGGPP